MRLKTGLLHTLLAISVLASPAHAQLLTIVTTEELADMRISWADRDETRRSIDLLSDGAPPGVAEAVRKRLELEFLLREDDRLQDSFCRGVGEGTSSCED